MSIQVLRLPVRQSAMAAMLLALLLNTGCSKQASDTSNSGQTAKTTTKKEITPFTDWEKNNHAGVDALSKNDLDAAEQYLLCALGQTEAFGERDERVGVVLCNLASVYEKKQMYSEALPLYQRAQKILANQFGPDYQGVAVVLNSMARVLCAEANYRQAVPLFRRSLKIMHAQQPPKNDDLLSTLQDYDKCLRKLHENTEAEDVEDEIKSLGKK